MDRHFNLVICRVALALGSATGCAESIPAQTVPVASDAVSTSSETAARPDLPVVAQLRADGYPATAKYIAAWFGSMQPLPEARGTVEEAGRRCLQALKEGDLVGVASFLEGEQTPNWDLSALMILSIPILVDDAAGKVMDRGDSPDQQRGFRLESRPGLGLCLVSAVDPEAQPYVFRSWQGAWYLRPVSEGTAGMMNMFGGMLPWTLGQGLAALDALHRSIAEQWSPDQFETFLATAPLDLAGRLTVILGFGGSSGGGGSGGYAPNQQPQVYSPVGPTNDPYLNAQIQNNINSYR